MEGLLEGHWGPWVLHSVAGGACVDDAKGEEAEVDHPEVEAADPVEVVAEKDHPFGVGR